MFRYFKFRLNDKVLFKEQQGHVYRIVGYRLEKSFYPQESWTTIVYELYREFDGLMTDAEEDELISVHDTEKKVKSIDINVLLDMYNDYKFLAGYFQDITYDRKRLEVLEKMRKIQN